MDIRPLKIAGAWEITPRQFPDDRGVFLESFRGDRLAEVIGHRMDVVWCHADIPMPEGRFVRTAYKSAFAMDMEQEGRELTEILSSLP